MDKVTRVLRDSTTTWYCTKEFSGSDQIDLVLSFNGKPIIVFNLLLSSFELILTAVTCCMDRSAEWVCPKSSDFTLLSRAPRQWWIFRAQVGWLGCGVLMGPFTMSGVKEDPQPLSHQNEALPASYQTFDEQPSMIPHAADSTLQKSYKVNSLRKDYHSLFLCDLHVKASQTHVRITTRAKIFFQVLKNDPYPVGSADE